MNTIDLQAITIDKIKVPFSEKLKINLSILRLDKIHPIISGNKWFKLKYYIKEALTQHKKTIASFGGAFSNHIIATAAAAKLYNLKSIGIIRGEEPKKLSHTLQEAVSLGMKLYFISRINYSNKTLPNEIIEVIDEIYLINEGGYGLAGAVGASSISEISSFEKYSHIYCAVGTGTMLAGIIKSSSPHQKIIGISVLKNNLSIESEINQLLTDEEKTKDFQIIHDYSFGGYAKKNDELIEFMNEFYRQTKIPTDFVYTGKLLFAIFDLLKKNIFKSDDDILIIHSGGLQGNSSLAKDLLIF